MANKSLSYIEIAERQLLMALRIYFEGHDYVSAITLAGAAEEILGKKLKDNGRANAIKYYVSAAHDIDEAFGDEKTDEQLYINELNRVKNMVKHMPVDGLIDDFKYEAEVMIHRAITNWRAFKPLSPSMESFLALDQ